MVRIPLPGQRTSVRVLLTAITTLLILRLAWLSDDSLITLRTALNAAHGWGFGFNALERVQGYTHPLWFLSWLGIGSLTGNWIYSIVLLSVALSGLTVFMVLQQAITVTRGIITSLAMIFSNSFMEYSTSGLENPLSHVVILGLILMTIKSRFSQPQLLLLGVLTAGALLTRLDLVVLIGLPIAFTVWMNTRDNRTGLVTFILGMLGPLVAWFLWSWLTYASFLPNTFQAKRNVNIPTGELIGQGVHYVTFSLRHDPMTAIVLVMGIATAFRGGRKILAMWSLGVIAYVVYVIQNGGDFMIGRFLSAPFIVALVVLILSINNYFHKLTRFHPVAQVSFGAIGLILISALSPPASIRMDVASEYLKLTDSSSRGVADERVYWTQRGLGLWTFVQNWGEDQGPTHFGVIDRETKYWPVMETPLVTPESTSVVCGGLGAAGIVAGPLQHVIDRCGLTDRFVAEKPFTPPNDTWRIGHFARKLPQGYVAAVTHSDPTLVIDPQEQARLIDLWDKIRD